MSGTASLISDAHRRLEELRRAREVRAAARLSGSPAPDQAVGASTINLGALVDELLQERSSAPELEAGVAANVQRPRRSPALGPATQQAQVTIAPALAEVYDRGTQTSDAPEVSADAPELDGAGSLPPPSEA